MTVLAHIKLAAAAFLSVSALAIVLSQAYGATVTDDLTALTSSAASATSALHIGTDAISAKLAIAE
jgi:hypothetical protein